LDNEHIYVIETDGSIHKMIFCGDCDWEERPVTTLAEIRAMAIDEFAEKLNKKITDFVLEHKNQLTFVSGVSMGWKFVDEIADQLKEE